MKCSREDSEEASTQLVSGSLNNRLLKIHSTRTVFQWGDCFSARVLPSETGPSIFLSCQRLSLELRYEWIGIIRNYSMNVCRFSFLLRSNVFKQTIVELFSRKLRLLGRNKKNFDAFSNNSSKIKVVLDSRYRLSLWIFTNLMTRLVKSFKTLQGLFAPRLNFQQRLVDFSNTRTNGGARFFFFLSLSSISNSFFDRLRQTGGPMVHGLIKRVTWKIDDVLSSNIGNALAAPVRN